MGSSPPSLRNPPKRLSVVGAARSPERPICSLPNLSERISEDLLLGRGRSERRFSYSTVGPEDIPSKVAADRAYQNAKRNNDKQNARIEHDKALARVMNGVLKDDTDL